MGSAKSTAAKALFLPNIAKVESLEDVDVFIRRFIEILEELNRRVYDSIHEINNVTIYNVLEKAEITAIEATYFVCTLVDETDTPSVNVYPIQHTGSNSLAGNVSPVMSVGNYLLVNEGSDGVYRTPMIFSDGVLSL